MERITSSKWESLVVPPGSVLKKQARNEYFPGKCLG
jgi:hypothetical protein